MKYEEINRKYTEKVTEYLAKGYVINMNTMRGQQTNEVCKIDLTNGTEYIRVLFEDVRDHYSNWKTETWFDYEIKRITVGRITKPIRESWTLWNDELEKISVEDFYLIADDYYGTKEECEARQTKHHERWKARHIKSEKVFPESAKKIVLSFMKRQDSCKSIKVSDIEKVTKEDGCYYVHTKKSRGYINRFEINGNRRVA